MSLRKLHLAKEQDAAAAADARGAKAGRAELLAPLLLPLTQRRKDPAAAYQTAAASCWGPGSGDGVHLPLSWLQ